MPLRHIIIHGRTQALSYKSIQSGGRSIPLKGSVDRNRHGNAIRTKFNAAIAGFHPDTDTDFVCLVFISSPGFLIDIDKLDKGDYKLANYRILDRPCPDGTSQKVVEATVYLNKRAVANFLKRVNDYIYKNTVEGNPKNQSLIVNIEDIQAAVIESFWQEPELPFPDHNEVIWWEMWMDRDEDDNAEDPLLPIWPILEMSEVYVSNRFLKFPEHFVYLVKGTAKQLANSFLYTDRLVEIRKPRETADFFTSLERQDQHNWIQHLAARTTTASEGNAVSICLLDTGVNTANPLLSNLISDSNLDVVEPAWTKYDTHPAGHGTAMAGLALYGDLTDAFDTNDLVQINHHLESIKLIERGYQHDPLLYGSVTQEAVARAEIMNPGFRRIACMAVTVDDMTHKGRPSSWSSAIDQIVFGTADNPNENTLFFVSSGNLYLDERINYPLSNAGTSIHDPAQSFNAITVGAYTLKDTIDAAMHPGAEPLAKRGAIAPSNTSSESWCNEWCRKPDITMEGGNQALQNGSVIDPESLLVLSTGSGGIGRSWLTSFGETSGATALASKFAAELYTHYPTLWPETIRGLIIHSADWTPQMLGNRAIGELTSEERVRLIRNVGYGVPNLEKAKYSAANSLSLIAERSLKPFKLNGSKTEPDQFHLFDLPWPTDVLQDLLATEVRFKITLSYFIEPNPGNKQYDLATSYRSHGLRFKMKGPNESLAAFKARVSKDMRDATYIAEGKESWMIGAAVRDKGSIHKDIWIGTAAALATRNAIAVYPVSGWWRNRRKHNRFNHSVRYSLILTIETPDINMDVYTPVLNMVSIEV
ncbi:S8 family peptidase [Chitinophaga rhizophila]|uniref:S8 family peptidase n=1 Tax=Chitinophaga rhizophila TaxID=2866212 RepID=A0ABS7GMI1_9BACT|nr:S8 family peptidase [Chitinophaga rhizophila]MBW8688169.1 S8 family peptidase [Chitinophaga rhizophila]